MTFSEHKLMLNLDYATRQGRTVVDVGAFRGTFSRPFAMRGWQIVAFEPEPQNRAQAEALLEPYQKRVTILPYAVSDQAQEDVSFFVSPDHPGIHSLRPFHASHTSQEAVRTVRLDDTLRELGVSQVTLLKIDTEGADFPVLKSFDFAQFQPEVVMCEFMDERSLPHFGYTHHDIVRYMAERDYVAYVSEWSPIQEYGRPGKPSTHRWLQCVPYPLDHAPAWGNLIFFRADCATTFTRNVAAYLAEVSPQAKALDIPHALTDEGHRRRLVQWLYSSSPALAMMVYAVYRLRKMQRVSLQ